MGNARQGTPSVIAAPFSAAEMCSIWAVALHDPTVSPDDDFFELGGDSLLALELVQLVEARTGIPLDLADLFLNPTPSSLSRAIHDRAMSLSGPSQEDR